MTSLPLHLRAALPVAFAVFALPFALPGCPDTGVSPAPSSSGTGGGTTGSSTTGAGTGSSTTGGGDAGGPVGKLKLIQTIVAEQDPAVDGARGFALSLDDTRLYATTWHGALLTFDRSPKDGSLAPTFSASVYNATSVALSPDGARLYVAGSNNPDQVVDFDLLEGTGEPVAATGAITGSSEGNLALAAGGTLLYLSQGTFIQAYRLDPSSGAMTLAAATPDDSSMSNFWLLADDAHGALYAQGANDLNIHTLTRYAVNAATGALTLQEEIVADLWWAYCGLAICPGTTRMYVPQEMGNIGYADIGGSGLAIPASFSIPDLNHVRSVALSPDCKNLYAVTQQTANGSLVVLARDDAGDLTWLQTIPMGPGTPIDGITEPLYAQVSADGKNVYVDSFAPNEGFLVFQRDATGAGLP